MYRDFIQKMLGVLYDIYFYKQFKGYINIIDICKQMGEYENEWIYEAVKYLDSMGFIKPIITIGTAYAKITPKGIG